MENYAKQIAQAGLKIQAIKLNPKQPFQWTSGYYMPIYNDNRMFLFYPKYRRLIADSFQELIEKEEIAYDVIAGTSTAGIPHGTSLADRLNCPFIYIRSKAKDYALQNQIEGIGSKDDLVGKKIIVIEDLISTGKSSAEAVKAIQDIRGEVDYCLSIFNYGLEKAVQTFNSLEHKCEVRSLLTYDILLEIAQETGYLQENQIQTLKEWSKNPFSWGEKYGFPKVEK